MLLVHAVFVPQVYLQNISGFSEARDVVCITEVAYFTTLCR